MNKAYRQQLQVWQTSLQSWENTVPPRALGFHRLRQQLLQKIEAELPRRFTSVGKETMANYQQQYDQLDFLSGSLSSLIRRAEQLEDESKNLHQKFSEVLELAASWPARCKQWQQQLAKLAETSERKADLTREEKSLEQISIKMHLHIDTLNCLTEADSLLNTLGSGSDTESLETELIQFRQNLIHQEPTLDLIARLKQLCQPLKPKADCPIPTELEELPALLSDIRGWARELNKAIDQVGKLDKRCRQLEMEWRRLDPNEIEKLRQDANNLYAEFTEAARKLRDDKYRELESSLEDLIYVCGDQPEIRKNLLSLKERRVNRYQAHRDWLVRLDETEVLFSAIADTQIHALKKRWFELGEELKKGLVKLKSQPLTDALKQQTLRLEEEIEAVINSHGVPEVLYALRLVPHFKSQLQELIKQADQVLADLSLKQQALRIANTNLQQQTNLIGIKIEDLAQDIEALATGANNRTLEQAYELAQTVEERLAKNQQFFLEKAQIIFQDLQTRCKMIFELLEQAGFKPMISQSTYSSIDPLKVSQQIINLNQDSQQLDEQIKIALLDCEKQRDQKLTQWAEFSFDGLDTSENEEGNDLFETLNLAAWRLESEPLVQLQQLSLQLKSCDAFLERLLAEQKELLNKHQMLKQRLVRFNQQELNKFCPKEWVYQIKDLVYGIPAQNQIMHRSQMDEASRLLDIVENQAKRLMAQTVKEQIIKLRERSQGDTSTNAKLLHQIAELENQSPLPIELRQQLQKALVQSKVRAH